MRMPCPNNVTYMTIWWYKCSVWISRISYSWHSQSSARRANQAHCKGKESCSQLPVAETKLAVTTKRSRFLDQILPRPVLQSPQSSMYLGGLRHLQLTAARRCNQANCNCDSGRCKRFANVASRHRRSRSSNTNYTSEKTFYFISTYFQLQRNWLQDLCWSFVLSEPHLAMGPHRLAIVCKPFLSVCHSNQTGTSCLTMTGSSNENQKSWISQHSLGKTDCKYMKIVWIVVWAIPSIGGRLAHSSQGSQRLQPWHALTLSPYLRQTVASGTSAFDSGKCKDGEGRQKRNPTTKITTNHMKPTAKITTTPTNMPLLKRFQVLFPLLLVPGLLCLPGHNVLILPLMFSDNEW